MDPLQQASLARAKAALDVLSSSAGAADRARAHAFIELGFTTLVTPPHELPGALSQHANELVRKAAAHATDDGWSTGDAEALAASYVASIAELSLLDQIKRYAAVLPVGQRRALVASGSTASTVTEGELKVVRRLEQNFSDVEPAKAAAIIVLTHELVNAVGGAGMRLFERELAASISAATNRAVLDMLVDSNTIEVDATGDPLGDLRAGLQAAGPSMGYVVAAPAGDVADLATRVENRGGMGVRGGTFTPGIEVVAVDDLAGIHVIPASRLALFDAGLELRSARHASVNMADSPTGPSTVVSLWQSGSLGILAERAFHLAGGAEIAVVGGTS